MSKKRLSVVVLSVGLLGACVNGVDEEQAYNDAAQYELNQPHDLIGDGERFLNSEYKTDDMRVFLNSETYDLAYTATLRLVVENNGKKPIEVNDIFHLTQGELPLGEQTAMYEPVQVDEGVTEYINVDLMMWGIMPDELYTIELTVGGEDVTLEFFTGDLDG